MIAAATRFCAWCGAAFTPYRDSTKTCSKQCGNGLHSLKRRRAAGAKPIGERRPCDYCGRKFPTRSGTQKFCTSLCRVAGKRFDASRVAERVAKVQASWDEQTRLSRLA